MVADSGGDRIAMGWLRQRWGSYLALAVLVFFTTIVVPALQLGAMLYLLAPLHAGRIPALLPIAVRMLQAIRPWGMTEVFILGLLVSLVKLGALARVVPGVGLWSFGALLFAIALWTDRPQLLRWAVRAFVVGGVVLLLFGAMNFYTHIGMYDNIAHVTMQKW